MSGGRGLGRLTMASAILLAGALAGCAAPTAVSEPVGVSNLVVLPPPPPGLPAPVYANFTGRIEHMCATLCNVPDSWDMVSLAWALDIPEDARTVNATLTWSPNLSQTQGQMAFWLAAYRDGEWLDGTGGDAWGLAPPARIDFDVERGQHGSWLVEVMNYDEPPVDVEVRVVIR